MRKRKCKSIIEIMIGANKIQMRIKNPECIEIMSNGRQLPLYSVSYCRNCVSIYKDEDSYVNNGGTAFLKYGNGQK